MSMRMDTMEHSLDNEWAVAFPVALLYSVWLAGVAPDKKNISCQYLCCLFKAKVQCLRKVIRLYTRAERHTSAERERGKEKYQQRCSPLILTSLACPLLLSLTSTFCPPPPYKQFSSPVMTFWIIYGCTLSLPSLSLSHSLYGTGRGCGSHVKVLKNNTQANFEKRHLMSREARVDGSYIKGHAVFLHKESTHAHTHGHTHNYRCNLVHSSSMLWCFARPFLLCPISRYSIKARQDVLENWPLFSQRLEG